MSCSNSSIKRWLVRRSASNSSVLACTVSKAPPRGRLSTHQAGLALWKDWRDSCLYSALIPPVTERSAFFVRNCRSHRRRQLMMPFSTGTGLERVGIVGPELGQPLGQSTSSRCYVSLQKQETRGDWRGSPVVTPMPKLVLSCGEKRLICLEGECSAYLSPMGWPGIYSICFPNWMLMRILSH